MKKRRTVLILLLTSLLIVLGFTFHNSEQVVLAKGTKIDVQVGKKYLKGTLNNSSAAVSLKRKLPLKTVFVKGATGLNENTADLNFNLSTKKMPTGSSAQKGNIGYWSPDKRLVFYWGKVDYYDGIHIIGHFDSKDDLRIIKNMKDNQKVIIKLHK
ncbi:cyclophilin-like fold protein [Companilactobacillus huachuanensis]|uniref:Cyclophilin-like fold protein n=1 Tax=Companilactobacillus huachuanensis TaxID=2559914 RepID=A0ABW1RNY3_9LACO|nr:cyclophilin-like fold protein [Companilactobacillus huachuanensis]